MTRRLVLAIIATTVVALVVAGLGTLLLAMASARRTTEKDVRQESSQLVTSLAALDQPANQTPAAQQRRQALVRAVARSLHLEDVAVMTFGPGGRTPDSPPDGVTMEDLDVPTLLGGTTVSGHNGNLVYAASSAPLSEGYLVAVVTRHANSGLATAGRWFVVAALAALGIGVLVAVTLGRRIAKPVREADAAAHRIAAGEFSTRLPEPSRRADDELADLTRSINTMAASLERSQGLEQQFLLSISHDLRTPLTSIQGYADAITDGATKDPQWAASIIRSEANRLDRLVRDLLELARLQAHTFSLNVHPVDLSAVTSAVVEGFRPDAEAAHVNLTTSTPGAVMVAGDGDRLAQVTANLIENSLRFARTSVHVGVVTNGTSAVLTVDDDGPGIALADRPHVFERLYVARHDPVRRESGSGLGLAIVRELVGAMHGQVDADATPEGGARLVVRLPLTSPLPPPPPR
jgi:two-component system sensor histidine kinase BaeS